jgi:ferredoxin
VSAPVKPLWRNPSGVWRVRNGLARLTHARRWNMPVIRFFFRVVVAGAHRMKTPVIGPIYKRLMLFTPAARMHTYGVLLPFNADPAVPASAVIDVGADLAAQADSTALPIDLLKDCLRKATYIASMPTCVCRDSFGCSTHAHELCCLFLSKAGKRVVSHGIAREITLDEALERVDKAAADGLVGQALWVEVEQFIWGLSNDDMDGFMELCFCCSCCCVGMAVCKSATRDVKGHFRPSGYQAVVDEAACVACGLCVDGCIGEAITMPAGATTITINLEHCVGCGLCKAACPSNALRIERTGHVFGSLQEQFLEQGRIPIVL